MAVEEGEKVEAMEREPAAVKTDVRHQRVAFEPMVMSGCKEWEILRKSLVKSASMIVCENMKFCVVPIKINI